MKAYFESPAVCVTTSWTTVYDSSEEFTVLPDAFVFTFELLNDASGGAALSDMRMQMKPHEDAEDWYLWLEGDDFSNNYDPDMMWCSESDIKVTASGEYHAAQVKGRGLYALRVQAITAANEANVLIRGNWYTVAS